MCWGAPAQSDEDRTKFQKETDDQNKLLSRDWGDLSPEEQSKFEDKAHYDKFVAGQKRGLDSSGKQVLGADYVSPSSKGTGFQLLTPDITDKTAQAAKMGQALQLISGRGRRSSMANGQYGDSMLGGF